jgi:hypothetical protein
MGINRELKSRMGWLLAVIGATIIYVGASALYQYFTTGSLYWGNPKIEFYNSDATVPYALYLVGGAWLIGYGIRLIRSRG